MAGPVKGTIGNEEVVLNDVQSKLHPKLLTQAKKVELAVVAQAEAAQIAQKILWLWFQQTGKRKELEEFEEVVEETGVALTRGFGHVFQGMQNVSEFGGRQYKIMEFSPHYRRN